MKVSIITVCRNAEGTIKETIESVLAQTYSDIEYIIIDGKSTDKTVSIINKYSDKLAYFVSESDNGMYEAMNKGIKASTGNLIYFLNSDDILHHSSTINNIVKHFDESDVDFLYGDVIELNNDTGHCRIKRHNNVNKAYLYLNTICQQSILYRKNVFEKYGYFNTEYKIAGDKEWLLRAFFKEKLKSKYIDIPFAIFTKGGLSNNETYDKIHSDERKKVKSVYFNPFFVSLTADMPKSFKSLVTRLMNFN